VAEHAEYVKKQLEREIAHLKYQYGKLKSQRKKKGKVYRLKELESTLLKHRPDMKINYDLLELVGTEPRSPPSHDKEIVRLIVAERYG